MTKVSFKQYSNFVDASDEELDEGFGEFVSKVFGGGKPDEDKLAKLKADRQKLLTKKTAAQIAKDKAKDELWKKTAQSVKDNAAKREADKKAGVAPTTPRSLAAKGRADELDWVRSMAESLQINEAVMSDIHTQLEELFPQLSSGDVDLYDVISGKVKGVSAKVQTFLQHRYDEIASLNHLHPDDDFEKINDRLFDELEAEFGPKK